MRYARFMARPWRIQYPNAVYHVTARGNNRQTVFEDDHDRHDFLALLGRAAERFQLQVFAFCLMDNHYHLFLRTPEPNLAQAMHWLNVAYSVRHNRRHDKVGHLFQGRYKSVLVLEDAHWIHLSMYVHLNPVRAGMVEDPADWLWSSFREYTRAKSRFEWLIRDEVLALYGAGAARARRYRRECLKLAGIKPAFLDQIMNDVVMGSRAQLTQLCADKPPAGQKLEVPNYLSASRPEVNFDAELALVAAAFDAAPEDLLRKRRNFPARLALYHHLVAHRGLRLCEVADRLGVRTSSVSMGIKRLEKAMDEDRKLRKKVEALNFK